MGTGYSHDLHGQQWMPVKKHKNRAHMKGCVPKDPLRPQEYAEAAPEPEEPLLYLTALSKTFSLSFPNQFCNPMQTFSIHSVLREELHRLTIRESPDGQRKVPGALSSYAALSRQEAD